MLLDDVKLSLRISNVVYDSEIQDLIDECKADLVLCGVLKIIDTDTLIKKAIITYCKANFGLNNSDSEKLNQSYEAIRNHLSMSIDYAYYKVTIISGDQCEITFDGESKQTNVAGIVTFYSKSKNHVEYKIDGIVKYVDITADTTIGV